MPRNRIRVVAWLGVISAGVPSAVAQTPLGPAFTFQGQLNANGNAANSPHDFRFLLFDAPAAGAQLGNADEHLAVGVTDGVFSVQINDGGEFGVNAFVGDARWIEVWVKAAGGPTYTMLAPRQPVSAAPYALFSMAPWSKAGPNLSYNAGNVGIGTSSPLRKLSIEGGGLNVFDSLNQGISFTSALFHVADESEDPAYTYSGLPSDTHTFWTNGSQRLTITPAGNVGIGTTTPAQRLSVVGTVQSTSGGFIFPDGTLQTTAATGGAGFWSSGGSNIFNNNAGNVGIGTTTPSTRLQVADDLYVDTAMSFVGVNRSTRVTSAEYFGVQARVSGASYGGMYIRTDSATGKPFYGYKAGIASGDPVAWTYLDGTTGDWRLNVGGDRLTVNGAGNVGVGTTAPEYRLDIVGRAQVRQGNNSSAGIYFYQNTPAEERGFVGMKTDTQMGLYGTEGAGWGLVMEVDTGDVAIGVGSPNARLHVSAADRQVAQFTQGGPEPGVVITSLNADSTYPALAVNGFSNNAPALSVIGTARVDILEVTGADVAEKFPISGSAADVTPGIVMEIDPDNPGTLRIARGAYSRAVAGVVSGANGLSAGTVLGNLPECKDAPPIALSGRVYVYCDATTGAIEPADLLTTSDTPGHAMKVTDFTRAQGAILGKAMTSLKKGQTGMVLVLVNLQ